MGNHLSHTVERCLAAGLLLLISVVFGGHVGFAANTHPNDAPAAANDVYPDIEFTHVLCVFPGDANTKQREETLPLPNTCPPGARTYYTYNPAQLPSVKNLLPPVQPPKNAADLPDGAPNPPPPP